MADKEFDVLLKVQTDAAGISSGLNPALAQTAAELESVEAAAAAVGSAIGFVFSGLILGAVTGVLAAVTAIPAAFEQSAQAIDDLVKQVSKLETEIGNATEKWQEMAREAQNFKDVAKLSDAVVSDLAAAQAKYNTFRSQELSYWTIFADDVKGILRGMLSGGMTPGLASLIDPQSGASKLADAQSRAASAMVSQVIGARADLDAAASRAVDTAAIKASGDVDALDARIANLKNSILELDPLTRIGPTAGPDAANAASEAIKLQGQLNELLSKDETLRTSILKAQDKQKESVQKTADQIEGLTAKLEHNNAVLADAAGQKAFDQVIDARKAAGTFNQQAVADAEKIRQLTHDTTLEELNKKDAALGTREAMQEQANALRDSQLHLAGIRASLTQISSDPFMTAGDKARLQYQLLEQSIKIITAEITNLQTKIAGGFFDPQHIDQARLKLIGYQVELNKVQADAAKLGAGIKGDLLEWANSFGTVSHQIASLITDTIGGAIQSLSSGISGLIFGTQTLAQAALQFGEQFVSSLIRIGLQMLAQFLLGQALREASAASASAIATPIALAYAPAASLAATASYGGAAVAGQAAMTESVLAAQGLASLGGFERGGYTGPAGGIVHGNEYVIDSTSLSRAGGPAFFDNLRVALNQRGGPRGAGTPGGGGPTGGGHHFYLFTDRESLHKHWQSNPTSKKTVIDWVNSAGGHLRT